MTKMYFFTYLFLQHTLPPFLPAQYFSSIVLFVEVLEKWGTRMDIGGSRQEDAVASTKGGSILPTDRLKDTMCSLAVVEGTGK